MEIISFHLRQGRLMFHVYFCSTKKGEVGANSDFCLEVDWNSQQEIMTFGWAWININVYNSYNPHHPLLEEKAAITSVQLL